MRAVNSLKSAKKDLEFLERNFIEQNEYLNEMLYSNMMLKNTNRDLSKKLHLSTVEKEKIQWDLTKQLKKAASIAAVSNLF